MGAGPDCVTLGDGVQLDRLLLISYHFGEAGATGGFRWAAHVRGLAAKGWCIDVITSDDALLEGAANVRVHRVPPIQWLGRVESAVTAPLRMIRRSTRQSRLIQSPGVDPESDDDRLKRLRTQADALPVWRPGVRLATGVLLRRAYDDVLALAADVHWSLNAARAGARLVRQRQHGLVVVSTPPHATQLAGHWLARRLGVPYVGDYRDPWSVGIPETDGSPLTLPIHRAAERRVQRSASLVIHNTPHARKRAMEQPDLPATPRIAIANGYDAEVDTAGPDPEQFRILVAGHIYPFMDPRTLMHAVRQFRDQCGTMASRIQLEFLGAPATVGGMSLHDLAVGLGVDACTTITSRVSRQEAISRQQRAAVLVSFDYPHPLAVPMRVYDYLRTRGSLLAFTREDSALASVARRIGSSPVAPDDVLATVRFLQAAFDRWRANDHTAPNDARGEFARKHQTERLDRLLRAVLAGSLDPAAIQEI